MPPRPIQIADVLDHAAIALRQPPWQSPPQANPLPDYKITAERPMILELASEDQATTRWSEDLRHEPLHRRPLMSLGSDPRPDRGGADETVSKSGPRPRRTGGGPARSRASGLVQAGSDGGLTPSSPLRADQRSRPCLQDQPPDDAHLSSLPWQTCLRQIASLRRLRRRRAYAHGIPQRACRLGMKMIWQSRRGRARRSRSSTSSTARWASFSRPDAGGVSRCGSDARSPSSSPAPTGPGASTMSRTDD